MSKRSMVRLDDVLKGVLKRLGIGAVVHQLMLGKSVSPVMEVEPLLDRMQGYQISTLSTVAATWVLAWTCPKGERWVVKRLECYRNGSVAEFSTFRFNFVGLTDLNNQGADCSVGFTAASGAVVWAGVNFADGVVLKEGDSISVYVSTLEAVQTFTFTVHGLVTRC